MRCSGSNNNNSNNNRDTHRDSGQDSSIGGNTYNGGNFDTDCMFAYDENEICEEDMPFAWQQTPTESFLLQKTKDLDSKNSNNNNTNTNNNTSSNSNNNSQNDTYSTSFLNSKQSILAQQCLTPPILTGFESTTIDGLKVSFIFFQSYYYSSYY